MTGYGYRPGRATLWLVAGITAGYLLFGLHRPPGIDDPWSLLLYTVDVVLPTSPFGLEAEQPADRVGFWTAHALRALGWSLSLAVLPAIARWLSRD